MEKKIEVRTLLTKKFCQPEWCLLHEVSNGAGFSRTNSADVIFMGLWPSRGLEINGVEIKSSRTDWLREIKNPQKAEAIFKYCDRFWLAAEEKVVLNLNEIPATWGYMLATGNKLKIIKEAPQLKPEPISRSFIAAMLKRATQGMIPESSLDATIEAKVNEQLESKKKYQATQYERLNEAFESHKADVKKFEDISGIKIRDWDQKRIAEAVRVVMNGGLKQIITSFEMNRKNVMSAIESMDKVIKSHNDANAEHSNNNHLEG